MTGEFPPESARPRSAEGLAEPVVPSGDGDELTLPFPVGTLVDAKFRVTEVVGQGGMGAVLLAFDQVLDRTVAIKVLRRSANLPESDITRFLEEARAMARVRHENVVAVYAFGEHESVPYIVMEYVPGSDLSSWLRGRDPLSIDESMGILDQVCRGVQAIHDAGTIHRDIKPGNILVGPNFRIALADMGLAYFVGQSGAGRASLLGIGTPAYAAPELVLDRELPPHLANRSDIYALGVTAYQVLVGRVPFPSPSIATVLAQQIEDPPPRPSGLNPELPAAFDEPLLAAMDKDPQKRPASATELFASLRDARRAVVQPPGTLRILVADGDPTFSSFVSEVLQFGFPNAEVEIVGDGDGAMRAMERKRFDVVLVELELPKLNGLEVVAAVRGAGRPRPRLLVTTAVGSAGDWNVLVSLGVDAFLLKPVRREHLLRSVHGVAPRARAT